MKATVSPSSIFRDVFGGPADDVPETIPLRILGLVPPVPTRAAIVSAFRRRVLEVHPDLQLAFDYPVLQDAAEDVGTRPEIRELVWARDVLLAMVPEPSNVTGEIGAFAIPRLPVTPAPKVCRQCERALGEREHYAVAPHSRHSLRAGWCWRCVEADDRERAKARRRHRRAHQRCAQCAAIFTPARADGRYCSPRCRQAAFRGRQRASNS
jgi:hypothetical protein